MSTQTSRLSGLNSSSALKGPCRCAATTNITRSGFQTIDGVSPVDTESERLRRVLLLGQTNPAENGIWIMQAGSWVRSKDLDSIEDIVRGSRIFVGAGTANFGMYTITSDVTDAFVLGTTAITIAAATAVDLGIALPTTVDAVAVFSTTTGLMRSTGVTIDGSNNIAGLGHTISDVASAATTDIGAVGNDRVRITGTTTITSFGTVANRLRIVHFAAALTLTHDVAALILPGGSDIVTAAGDCALFGSDASGNWRCFEYLRANAHPLTTAAATIASAATTDLGSVVAQAITVSGTTTITSFGSTAPTGALKFVEFSGALTLTHNAASLILPGASNITTAAGDCLVARHEGSGNWRVLSYVRTDGHALTVLQATIASASTTDLGSSIAQSIVISGTTTITSFGSSAPTGALKFIEFSGALTLTHNGTSLILPGALSIVTVAGDCLVARHEGSGNWRVLTYTRGTTGHPLITGAATIASASTTDLGSTLAQAITVSGTTTITSFGSSAPTGATKFVEFSGALTLTHNGTSLILPGALNIATVAGDCLIARHEGSGNWRVLHYVRANGHPLITAEASIASASTVDLGSALAQTITITGTTTITSFGSSAPTGAIKFVKFSGALTLTHNATSLIIPAAANVTTVAGDALTARHEGSGNWRVLAYHRADGTALVGGGATVYVPAAFTSAAIQAAVDLAAAAGGGTVQLLDGDYAMSAAALISTDDIWLVGSPNTRLLAPASATVIGGLITVQITGLGTDTTIGSNAAIGDRDVVLTSAANIAVDDYVRLTVTKGSYFYSLFTKCLAKVSNTITIADPLPFTILTTDTASSIRKYPMLFNVKLKGLRFFGNGNSGVGTRGVLMQRIAFCSIEDLYFEGFHNAAGINYDSGYRNFADHIAAHDCGDANESDIWISSQTGLSCGELRSNRASGFGPQIQSCAYSSFGSIISDKANNRGLKLNGTVFSQFGSLQGHNSGSTGVAITLGSCDNTIDSVLAVSNRGGSGNDIGLWFSAQDNVRNRIGRVNLKNNLDWDIDIGSTDNDNRIADAIYTTRRDQGSRNLAGIPDASFISGGYAVSVNANSVGDTAIAINCPTPNYRISSVVIQNVGTTASLTTAQFGIFTATGGGGTAISAAGQVLTALTSNTTGANGAVLNHVPATNPTAVWTVASNSTLYFRITTAQGAAATLRVYVIIHPLPSA